MIQLSPRPEDIWDDVWFADPDRACRHCGCTETKACVIDGVPCHWVYDHVCSNPACVAKAARSNRWRARSIAAVLMLVVALILAAPIFLILCAVYAAGGKPHG